MFHSDALSKQSHRLSGDVSIAIPPSWQLIGYLIGGSVIAGIVFLSLASYARIETVSGIITPSAGVSSIYPTRAGVMTALPVHEGQDVQAGAELATVRAEEDSAGATTPSEQIAAAIAQQDSNLAAQSSAVAAAAQAQMHQVAAQQAGLQAEAEQLQSQIRFQRDLVASAQRDLAMVRPVADSGYISAHDIRTREETLLSRQQGLAQLMQALSAKHAAAQEAERNARQIASQSQAQSAGLAASRAEVARAAASAASARAYVLRAPVAGRVTALTARVGQAANVQSPLMVILPAGSDLRAELAVPSSAIGFIKPGQEVHLAIDAFPYERFGTLTGRILTVAADAISRQGANGSVVSAYPVTVALGKGAMEAYGRQEPLVSGMTLTARIVTERQSLLGWLFEPLYAVRRR